MFKAFIVKVAAQSCGQKIIGACCSGNLRACWWTSAVKEAGKLKKEYFEAWSTQEVRRLLWSQKQKHRSHQEVHESPESREN